MTTRDNLQAAFAGESQANRKYLAFAQKAEKEGFGQIAKLFRAAAAAETIHAHAHLQAMGGIQSTLENLEEAIAGEGHEFKKCTRLFWPWPRKKATNRQRHHSKMPWQLKRSTTICIQRH